MVSILHAEFGTKSTVINKLCLIGLQLVKLYIIIATIYTFLYVVVCVVPIILYIAVIIVRIVYTI